MKELGNKLWNWCEKLARKIIKGVFHLIHRDLSEDALDSMMQFVKFGIIGVSNTLVNYVIYVLSLMVMGKMHIFLKGGYVIAQVIAFFLSVLWSFYWNNKLVFVVGEGERRSMWKALFKTYVSYSFTGLFLNSILLVVWVRLLHLSAYLGPILNIFINVPINFLINKFWAFRTVKDEM